MSMHPMLNTAVTTALKAGKLIIRSIDQLDTVKITPKQQHDFVTEVDQKTEHLIVSMLKKAYPTHGYLCEESGETPGQEDYVWIIDPLDGTTNFIHGLPHYAVSIALRINGRIEHGVVYDPIRHELFTATRGSGAYLNNRRLRVSSRTSIENSLLGTGFPFLDATALPPYLKIFQELASHAAGIRRAGSAALDLAYVAAGRFDGFWEAGLKIWDMAAGILLVREAGGLVCDFNGSEEYLTSGDVIAGTPKICKAIAQVVQNAKS